MRKNVVKYYEILMQGEKALEGLVEAKVDAFLLFSEAFHMSRAQYLMRRNEEITSDTQQYRDWLEQRKRRIPLQYILNSASFMGYDFYVNENVLIPRQDTEVLVEQALNTIKEYKNPKVLDMCTGSGCIAISIALLSNAQVTAVDISDKALEVAAYNCKKLSCTNVDLIQSNLFDKIENKFEMITSNPPYIPTKVIEGLEPEVKDFEPMLALDGSEDGLEFYRRLAIESKNYLVQGGSLLMEIGCEQANDVMHLLEVNGYSEISVIKDLANLDRVVKARWIDGGKKCLTV